MYSLELQITPSLAIGMSRITQDPGFVGRFQDHGTRPITKQNARVPIIPVHPPTERIGTNHETFLIATVGQKLTCRGNAKHESRTSRRQVKGHRRGGTPEIGRNPRCGTEHVIGSAGTANDQIQIGRRQTGHVQRVLTGAHGQFAQILALNQDMPLRNARARLNPFVVGFDDLFEILIGNDSVWNGTANANGTAFHGTRIGVELSATAAAAAAGGGQPCGGWFEH